MGMMAERIVCSLVCSRAREGGGSVEVRNPASSATSLMRRRKSLCGLVGVSSAFRFWEGGDFIRVSLLGSGKQLRKKVDRPNVGLK